VSLEAQLSKLRQGVARLIDSYTEGFIEKSEFEPRLRRQRERISEVEEQLKHLADEAMLEQELRQTVGHLQDFAVKVTENLDQITWVARRDILRTLIKRIEIGKTHITIIFRVGPSPGVVTSRLGVLQDCRPHVYAHA
jgi:site-specific DNA recombinase